MSEATEPIEYRGWTITYEPNESIFGDQHFVITQPTGGWVGRERTIEAAKAQIDAVEEEEATRRDVN
jgi:hypothetical protein